MLSAKKFIINFSAQGLDLLEPVLPLQDLITEQ